MGKETSYKQRVRAGLPDSLVGRKAVDLGLITQEQLRDAIDHLPEDAFLHDAESALATALVTMGLLTQMQVDALLETNPPVRDLGKYRLGRKLGRGGMGIVFEAEDRQLGRRVALKMLRTMTDADPDEMAEDEERFVREGRLAAQLPKHPNIVSVYEAGDIGARRYIAMELIRGDQFQEWRARKGIPLRLKVSVLRDVARAVDHAHRHGVIHRDLKPANILVDRDNIPHVTDFGLAKQMDRQAGGSLTCSGFLLGTPSYASPEQAQGLREVDARTDVWALGVMLYEVMADRLPFQGANPMDILIKTIRDPVVPPSTTAAPGALTPTDKVLERICMRALSKDPTDRYPTAAAFSDDLTRWLEGRKVLTRRARVPRHRWTFIGVASGLLALVIGSGLFLAGGPGGAKAREERARGFVDEGRKLLAKNRPSDALIQFGWALAEDPDNRAAKAGRKEAEEKMGAPAKPAAKPPAPEPEAPRPRLPKATAPGGIVEQPALKGHRGGVHLLAFSPDGRQLVTGSFDRTVRIWDFAGRAERKQLADGLAPFSLAASADGRWIAAGFIDGSIRSWDATGTPARSFTGHGHQVVGLAFTPDGAWLTSASTDGSARLWNVAAGTQTSLSEGYPKGALSLALSRDGRAVAVGSADRLVRVLQVPSWDETKVLDGVHASMVKGLAFSPDGKRLCSGGADGNVVLTEIESGRRAVLSGHEKDVQRVAFSPDGRWIASIAQDQTLRLWDASSATGVGAIAAPDGFFAVAFSPGGELMVAGSADGRVRVWNVMALHAAR